VKGFGCRPGASDRCSREGPASESLRRTNARESAKRLAVYGDLAGSGFGGGYCFEDRCELIAADDCGLAAAAVLDGVMENWSVMRCRRLHAPG
jgi:hypothetical protein